MRPSNIIESPESSSPIVTRAVAAGLLGELFEPYQLNLLERFALKTLGLLPQSLTDRLVNRFGIVPGLNPEILRQATIDEIIIERLKDYDSVPGRFPVIVTGAALGGASAILSLALNGLFLPQAFVASLKGGSATGDPRVYYARSATLAKEIASENREVLTIQHFDPVHDGYVTRFLNHLRIKLLDLPSSWKDFVRSRLEPGGAVVYLECGAEWLRYRVGERSVFQVGGWGGIPPEEYLEGSDRLQRYTDRAGLKYAHWALPGFPLECGPESEWGCEPALGEALERYCQAEGYRLVRIAFHESQEYSRLAYRAIARLLEKEGREPAGVMVEMFSQFDPTVVLKTGLLPLWLVYYTEDSLAFLKSMTPVFPLGKPVFFAPLISFSRTPDLVPWEEWSSALKDLDWINLGARRHRYPADAARLAEWAAPLRRWAAGHHKPIRARLSADELLDLASNTY